MNRKSNIEEITQVSSRLVLEGKAKEGLLEALKVAVPFVVDSTKLPEQPPKYWDASMAVRTGSTRNEVRKGSLLSQSSE